MVLRIVDRSFRASIDAPDDVSTNHLVNDDDDDVDDTSLLLPFPASDSPLFLRLFGEEKPISGSASLPSIKMGKKEDSDYDSASLFEGKMALGVNCLYVYPPVCLCLLN